LNRLRRFLLLESPDRSLLVKTFLWLWIIRLSLWLLPFNRLLNLVKRAKIPHQPVANKLPLDRFTWAVATAGRYVPMATCLTQALTAHILLIKGGYNSILHIGVSREDKIRLETHAWVESHGNVIVGDSGLERYTPLLSLKR